MRSVVNATYPITRPDRASSYAPAATGRQPSRSDSLGRPPSDQSVQDADGDRLDARSHAQSSFCRLDVKVCRGRLDTEQRSDVVVGFSGRRPLQAFDFAQAEPRVIRIGDAESFRCTATLPNEPRQDLQHCAIGGAEADLRAGRHGDETLKTAGPVDRDREYVLPTVRVEGLHKLELLRGELQVRHEAADPHRADASACFDRQHIVVKESASLIELEPIRRPIDEEESMPAGRADAGPSAARAGGKPDLPNDRPEVLGAFGCAEHRAALERFQQERLTLGTPVRPRLGGARALRVRRLPADTERSTHPAPFVSLLVRIFRNFRASSSCVNGFESISTPGSRRLPWMIALSVYPEVNSTRSLGRRSCALRASSRASRAPGSTTSVSRRSIEAPLSMIAVAESASRAFSTR